MNTEDRMQLELALVKLFKMFDKTKDDDVIEMYISCLQEYSVKEIRIAMSQAAKECEFCPKPVNIIKHLKPNSEDIHAKAIVESQKALHSLKTGNSSYLKGCSITESLMQGRWNLETVNVGGQFYDFFPQQFIKAYIDNYNSPAMTKALTDGNPMGIDLASMIETPNRKVLESGE
jgi:hypothetical protein